jgi:PKD repeat protein
MTKGPYLSSALAAVLMAASACTVHNPEAPGVSGPSEFALSIEVSATPDSISQDGASQSSIIVTAHDATGALKPGVSLRLDMQVAGVIQDFGTLSARYVVTGTDGRARAIYTAPPASPIAGGSGTVISISAEPIGSNSKVSVARTTDIRLVPAGVITSDAPKAQFITTPAPPIANSPTVFDATGSTTTAPARVVSYTWNFGDGTPTVNTQEPTRTTTHTYTSAGTYIASLTVTDDRGLAGSTTRSLSVGGGAVPVVLVSVSPTAPQVGQLVSLSADASRPGVGHTLVQFDWNFGDGATGSGVRVTHVYAAAGIYSVVLNVIDEAGQRTTVVTALNVTASGVGNPVPVFTYTPQSPVSPNTAVTFDASASTAPTGSTIVRYQWQFRCASTGCVSSDTVTTTSSPTITFSYPSVGQFLVTLTVIDNAGHTGTLSRLITVQ